MHTLRAFWVRLAGVFGRGRAESEFAAEMESHVAMDMEDGVRAGLSEGEARRRALVRLGGVEQVKQAHRERRTLAGLDDLLQDLRYAARMMAHNRAFTVVAVLTLAVGIGASSAIFSAVKPILLDPLPYPGASRVMMLWERSGDGHSMPVTFGTFYGLKEGSRSFDALAVMKPWQPAVVAANVGIRPERLEGQRVSAEYFRALGIVPVLGRDFGTDDDRYRGPNVVILSDGLWQRRFGGDRAILGKQVRLDEEADEQQSADSLYTVVGVMPRAFEDVLAPSAELWAPLQYNPALPADGREWGHHLRMVGRLREGVRGEQAQSELGVILHALAQRYAKGYDSSGGAPVGMVVNPLQHDLTEGVRPSLLAVLGAVVLVLLIACVNVANLLLARGSQRHAEFAMRAALGAAQGRLVRQLLTESLLLAAVGGTLGMGVALAGVRALVALSPPGLPRVNAIGIDGAAFLFALGLTTAIGIVVGLVSTLQASRDDLHAGMKQRSRSTTGGRQWTRNALVVTEVSLAVVLLVSTGLLLRSMQRLLAVDPGFDTSNLLTMQVQEDGPRYDSDAARLRFFDQAAEKVRQLPGVVAAGFSSQLPLSGDEDVYGIQFERDTNPDGDSALRYAVTPGYMEAMHIPLRRGRMLNDRDVAGAPVAVLVSESLAKRKFAGQDPIGQRVRLGPDIGHADRPWATIVGVVGDVRQESLAIGEEDAFYTTTAQWAWGDAVQSLVLRTRGEAAALAPAILAPAIQDAIWSVDKEQPIVRVATMEKLVADTAAERRFVLVLFEAFGLVALALAAIGLYGVLSGSVAERTQEIGVRAALGATRGDLLALVMRQGLTMTCVGLAIGLCGAFAMGRAMSAMLFTVSWRDGATYLGTTALLLGVSGVACFIPARRAASVDPMQALRAE